MKHLWGLISIAVVFLFIAPPTSAEALVSGNCYGTLAFNPIDAVEDRMGAWVLL